MTDSKTSPIALRPASERDVGALARLWFDTWRATSPHLEHPEPFERWEERFRRQIIIEETVIVAEINGRLAGFMALREADGYVHLLYVAPDSQGGGVGTRLLDEAARRCPTGLNLSTLESNANARRFYERRGWTPGERTLNPRTGHPMVRYSWAPPVTGQSVRS